MKFEPYKQKQKILYKPKCPDYEKDCVIVDYFSLFNAMKRFFGKPTITGRGCKNDHECKNYNLQKCMMVIKEWSE